MSQNLSAIEKAISKFLQLPMSGEWVHGLERTFSAVMICSGAIVFLDSCSQISFASDDIRCMNSTMRVKGPVLSKAANGKTSGIDFTYTAFYHQITRLFRACYVVGQQFCRRKTLCERGDAERVGEQLPEIIFATVALGSDKSSSEGGAPEWPSRSDMVDPRSKTQFFRPSETSPQCAKAKINFAEIREGSRVQTVGSGELGAAFLSQREEGHFYIKSPHVLFPLRPPPLCPPYVFSLTSHACSDYDCLLLILLGQPSQPKAFHAGTNRQVRLCQAQMGTRIQRLPR